MYFFLYSLGTLDEDKIDFPNILMIKNLCLYPSLQSPWVEHEIDNGSQLYVEAQDAAILLMSALMIQCNRSQKNYPCIKKQIAILSISWFWPQNACWIIVRQFKWENSLGIWALSFCSICMRECQIVMSCWDHHHHNKVTEKSCLEMILWRVGIWESISRLSVWKYFL